MVTLTEEILNGKLHFLCSGGVEGGVRLLIFFLKIGSFIMVVRWSQFALGIIVLFCLIKERLLTIMLIIITY